MIAAAPAAFYVSNVADIYELVIPATQCREYQFSARRRAIKLK